MQATRDLWRWTSPSGRTAPLTGEGASDFEPTWSRSGWIYFTSLREQTTAIWRIRSAGGAPIRVTMGIGPESQPSMSA